MHLDLEQKRRHNHTKAIKNKALHGFAHEDSELREGQREGTVGDPAFREGADERIFAYKHRRARAVSEGRGEKRTLDLDLTHNPDVTDDSDDSDDSDPGEAGFTSGFNFSAKAAISRGHFASFATASTEACGRAVKDF